MPRKIDWSALMMGTAIFTLFLFLTNQAGKSFHAKARHLRDAAAVLKKERHQMISEQHRRDGQGNYVHGDPVWKRRG